VIATNLDNKVMLELSERARAKDVPIILIRQYGLIGYIRIIANEVCVAEQKPYKVELQDLRLNDPFEELMNYAMSFDLAALPIEKHSHVPYVVLLLQAMEAWKKGHDGQRPKNFAEKGQFKELLKSMALEADKEINFDEAAKNAFFMHQSPNLPDNVQEIFDIPKIDDAGEKDPFWVCCSVLKKFHGKNKRLPVSGTIPDMTSHTEYYLSLQKVYVEKSVEDLKECTAILEETVKERGIDSAKFPEYQEQL
jgi:amyloid beta precursor protein binding protein 1